MEEFKLVVRKETIFTKIKNYIYRIFHKKLRKQEIKNSDSKEENLDKNYALEIYKKLKAGEMNTEDIPNNYLNIIKEFLKKEIEMKRERLNSIQTEVNANNYTIKHYEEEKKKYQI